MTIVSILLEVMIAVIIMMLYITEKINDDKSCTNKYMTELLLAFFLLVILDAFAWMLDGKTQMLIILKVVCVINYIMGVICGVLFHYYLLAYLEVRTKVSRYLKYFVWPTSIIAVVLWFTSIWTGLVYSFEENGNFIYSDYHLCSLWLCSFSIVIDMVIVVYYRKNLGKRDTIIFLAYGLLPLAAIPFSAMLDTEVFIYMGMLFSIMLIHCIISVEQHKQFLEQTTLLMHSQVQPHFLYNSLNVISYLCTEEPELAREATERFACYLRRNLDLLKSNELVPFADELNHTETYIWLEQLRFREKLTVVYNIENKMFKIPLITLQPIVENAIKHGICGREDGGIVRIGVEEMEKYYEIYVEDNGVGFDMNTVIFDEKDHVGIKSVRDRLKVMCNGTLEIESTIGIGTMVKIYLPKNYQTMEVDS